MTRAVLLVMDFEYAYTRDEVRQFLQDLVDRCPTLKRDADVDFETHWAVVERRPGDVARYLNVPLGEKQWFLWASVESTQSRFYFKHLSGDAAAVSRMLLPDDGVPLARLPSWPRVLMQTAVAVVAVLRACLHVLGRRALPRQARRTDVVAGRPMSLRALTAWTATRGLTVDDFMHALAVKTHAVYATAASTIVARSDLPAFYVDGSSLTLLTDVRDCTRGEWGLIQNVWQRWVPESWRETAQGFVADRVDVAVTSVRGSALPRLRSAQCVTTAAHHELGCTAMTVGDKVHVMWSFEKGVYNRRRLKRSLAEAYRIVVGI